MNVSLQVREESMCPGGVCVTCASDVLAAEELRLFTRDSLRLWEWALTKLQTLPMAYSEYSSANNVNSICAFITDDDGPVEIYKDFTGGEPGVLINRTNAEVDGKRDKRRVMRNGPMATCTDCLKDFASPYLLRVHLQNSDQKDACKICGIVFPRGIKLKQHLENTHDQTALLCKSCPTLHATDKELKKHKDKAHKPGALTCTACGREFKRKSSLDQHALMHVVLTCRLCGNQYSNRSCYRVHRSTCEPDAKPKRSSVPRLQRSNLRDPSTFECDYCHKCYSTRPQLKNHILWIHLDHRPHQCSFCGKRFYTAARLTEHTVVHTRARNFECDICGAKLVSKSAALYHRRRHTGEKPYVCDDCGAAFISSSRRLEHAKRKHNKGTRFQCLHCPSAYVRRRELQKHEEKHHTQLMNNLPVVVPMC